MSNKLSSTVNLYRQKQTQWDTSHFTVSEKNKITTFLRKNNT